MTNTIHHARVRDDDPVSGEDGHHFEHGHRDEFLEHQMAGECEEHLRERCRRSHRRELFALHQMISLTQALISHHEHVLNCKDPYVEKMEEMIKSLQECIEKMNK